MRKLQNTKTLITLVLLASFLVVGVSKAADGVAPVVTSFVIPSSSDSLVVPITAFTATDDVAVTGFFVSESSFAPDPNDGSWIPVAPSNFVFATEGDKTLYAWVKDAADNVSLSLSDSVSIAVPVSDIIAPAAPMSLSVL